MPIFFQQQLNETTKVAVWETTESEDFFYNELTINPLQEFSLEVKIEKRRREHLSILLLLKKTLPDIDTTFEKDAFGKPFFTQSTLHFSISHSKQMAAIMVSGEAVGIDIQHITPKIANIAGKFLSETELKNINLDKKLRHLHVYWGAKEAIYKAYGKKELDFRKHIFVPFFDCSEPSGSLSGSIVKGTLQLNFDLNYVIFENFVLVYGKQI